MNRSVCSFVIAFILIPVFLCGQEPGKLEITKLCDNFYIFTTYQKYKETVFPANGLYVVTNNGVIMIDTPWDPTQFQPLLDSIQIKHGQKVKLCIATHSHEDRTGGLEYYNSKGIKTYTSVQTDRICIEKNQKRASNTFSKDTTYNLGATRFETYYPGPGHTPDNIIVWFGKEKVLYGGCFIKSTEAKDLGNLADADVNAWKNSIQKLMKKYEKPLYIIPGHQSWTSPYCLKHTDFLVKKYLRK